MKFLVGQGGIVDAFGYDGLTAFHKSVLDGDTKKASVLLAAGANVDAEGKDGKTALNNATMKQDFNTVIFLIEEGADPNLTDGVNKTALGYAIDKLKTISEHLKSFCDWQIENSRCYRYGIGRGRIQDILKLFKILQVLVEGGSDVGDVGQHEKTILDLAKQEDKQLAVMKYFRTISEEYYTNEELRGKIERSIEEYCSERQFPQFKGVRPSMPCV